MDWSLFIPELSLLAMAAVFLSLACLPPNPRRDHAVALGMAAAVMVAGTVCLRVSGNLFGDVYRVDLFSQVFKACLGVGLFLIVCISGGASGIAPNRQGEFFALLAMCTLAMMMMVSGSHLLVVYLALELSSYSLYVLIFLRRAARLAMPGGLRYFLVGICASAVMLFGLALIYGATGTLRLTGLAHAMAVGPILPTLVAGVVLALGGLLFKLAVFPFHFWAPDAYEAAPNPVAAFIATASRVAAVGVLVRVTGALHGAGDILATALIVLAIVSMTIGNVCAIAQRDFKRLMAFSSIAHAGYLMIGILCMTPAGQLGASFYVAAVLVMKFTCFLVMIGVATDGRNLKIEDLAGLHHRAPILAAALMMALFGLAGIPPTIGFTGKLLLFKAAVAHGYLALVIIAMINVVISLYYYLLVLKAAYLDAPPSPKAPLAVPLAYQLLALLMIAVIVGIGFYPTPVIEIVQAAIMSLLS